MIHKNNQPLICAHIKCETSSIKVWVYLDKSTENNHIMHTENLNTFWTFRYSGYPNTGPIESSWVDEWSCLWLICTLYMLTLESRCILVVLGGVLISRTLPNRKVINKELFCHVNLYIKVLEHSNLHHLIPGYGHPNKCEAYRVSIYVTTLPFFQ